MAAKDREIAALAAELRALEGGRAAGAEASGRRGPAGATEGGPSSAEGSDDNAPAAPDDDRNFLRLGLQSQVSRLRQLAAIHDLHNTDPTGGAPSPHVLPRNACLSGFPPVTSFRVSRQFCCPGNDQCRSPAAVHVWMSFTQGAICSRAACTARQ